MKFKVAAIVFTILFFGAMIFLSIFAGDIRNRMLPNVKVSRLTKEEFIYEYTTKLGIKVEEKELCRAIPKRLYDNDEIYVIQNVEINGEPRTIAKKITLEIGRENDGYYEVVDRFFDDRQRFIMHSDKEIHDGDEVFIVK